MNSRKKLHSSQGMPEFGFNTCAMFQFNYCNVPFGNELMDSFANIDNIESHWTVRLVFL